LIHQLWKRRVGILPNKLTKMLIRLLIELAMPFSTHGLRLNRAGLPLPRYPPVYRRDAHSKPLCDLFIRSLSIFVRLYDSGAKID
jgi:hypothetical protein